MSTGKLLGTSAIISSRNNLAQSTVFTRVWMTHFLSWRRFSICDTKFYEKSGLDNLVLKLFAEFNFFAADLYLWWDLRHILVQNTVSYSDTSPPCLQHSKYHPLNMGLENSHLWNEKPQGISLAQLTSIPSSSLQVKVKLKCLYLYWITLSAS